MRKIILIKICALALLAVTACSKDDDPSNDLMSKVPTGTIVPVEEREATLVGFEITDKSQLKQSAGAEQKWWEHNVSEVTFDCPDYDETDNVSETTENFFFAFKPDGVIYYKEGMDGTEYQHHSWEWASSKKEAILVEGVSFKFTELNANTVTYASVQGEPGCQVLTWEKFTH